MNKTYLAVTASVFALVALLHALRLVLAWPVVVGTWEVPMWLSGFGLVLAGALCLWALAQLRRD
mgnify:CR=1 FL=1